MNLTVIRGILVLTIGVLAGCTEGAVPPVSIAGIEPNTKLDIPLETIPGGQSKITILSQEARLGGATCELETISLHKNPDRLIRVRCIYFIDGPEVVIPYLPFGEYQMSISMHGKPLLRDLVSHVSNATSLTLLVPESTSFIGRINNCPLGGPHPLISIGSSQVEPDASGNFETVTNADVHSKMEIFFGPLIKQDVVKNGTRYHTVIKLIPAQPFPDNKNINIDLPAIGINKSISGGVKCDPSLKIENADLYKTVAVRAAATGRDGSTIVYTTRCDKDGNFILQGLSSGQFTLDAVVDPGKPLISKPIEVSIQTDEISDQSLLLTEP